MNDIPKLNPILKPIPEGCTTFRRYKRCMSCMQFTESNQKRCSNCDQMFLREATDLEQESAEVKFQEKMERD